MVFSSQLAPGRAGSSQGTDTGLSEEPRKELKPQQQAQTSKMLCSHSTNKLIFKVLTKP